MDDVVLVESVRLAKLCNTTPWVIENLPDETVRPYLELLMAIDQANREIHDENGRRIKAKSDTLLRRITLAD